METINITLNDLASVRNIINLAVKRGAFDASEAKDVGTVYELIDNFINRAVEAMKDEESANSNESTVEETKGE